MMHDDFIPLLPRNRTSSSITPAPTDGSTASAGQLSAPFQPVSLSAAPTPQPCSSGQPTITLQRHNGVVSGIRVQCSCGQVIDLDCEYETQPVIAPAQTSPAGQISPVEGKVLPKPAGEQLKAKRNRPN